MNLNIISLDETSVQIQSYMDYTVSKLNPNKTTKLGN